MTLDDVQSLLWFGGRWHVKLRGARDFFSAPTVDEALRLARGGASVVDDDLF